MPKKILKTISLLIISFVLLFESLSVFATENCQMTQATEKDPQITWPASPLTTQTLDKSTNIPQLIQYFFEWGVGLGGLAVFIALIIAGIQFITSTADPGKLNEAKDRIKSSVIGLALLLSSWAIFNLINPSLNTLEDLPDLTGIILNGGISTGETCTIEGPNAWECCKLPLCNPATDCIGLPGGASDPNCCAGKCVPATDCAHLSGGASDPNCCVKPSCAPENFVCCQKNDSDCIKGKTGGIGASMSTKKPIGDSCTDDKQCGSGYCKCHRDRDPWEQYCADNPLTCINIIGEPEMGCDYIGFFDAPDFGGTDNYFEVTSSNSGWVNMVSEIGTTEIRSYQAYKASKNVKGDYIDDSGNVVSNKDAAYKVPCGQTACGCTLAICNDPGSTASSCTTEVDYGLAFNTNVDASDYEVARIQDETKSKSAKIKNAVGGIFGKFDPRNWW